MEKDDMKTLVLGREYDHALRFSLFKVLEQLGGRMLSHDWCLGGSQEISGCVFKFDSCEIVVESETYIGLSITGPGNVVKLVEDMLAKPA